MMDLLVSGLRAARVAILLLLTAVFVVAIGLANCQPAFAAYQSSSEAEQQERYEQALQAYKQNRFTDARTLFEGVRGSHSQEAKKYLDNIKAYKAAMEDADGMMRRSPDELDAANLDFAIGKYQEAIAIKSDGPWTPKEKLDKATAQKAKLLQLSGPATEARKRGFCEKLGKASAARSYEQARYLACALANDDPAYQCGGDEALHLCQQMKELAQMSPRPPSYAPKAPDGSSLSASGSSVSGSSASVPKGGEQKSVFDTAKAAFDANDFEKARTAFQRVSGEEKASAQDYLTKITQYQNSMKLAAKFLQDAKYPDAQAAYQDAAKIKPDGPGNPLEQASLMVLQEGVSQFYAGNYSQASESLADYVQENTQKTDIAHFYMGACELARFFLAGGQDGSLREQALGDFRKAKEAGFRPKDLEVSPKILKVYDEL
jgi:outer membrane protein assembly factor BamD (BamD/ComL family)